MADDDSEEAVQVNFRLSRADRRALRAQAARDGRSMTDQLKEWIRARGAQVGSRVGKVPTVTVADGDEQ